MKHLAAYLLLHLGGNTNPSFADIKAVLSSVGIETDPERVGDLLRSLDGKDLDELMAKGSEKLAIISAPSAANTAIDTTVKQTGTPDQTALDIKSEESDEDDDSEEMIGIGLFDL